MATPADMAAELAAAATERARALAVEAGAGAEATAREAATLLAQAYAQVAELAADPAATTHATAAFEEVKKLSANEVTAPVVIYFAVLGVALFFVLSAWFFAGLRGGVRGLFGMTWSLPIAGSALYVCWRAIFKFMMEVSSAKKCGPGKSPAELLGCTSSAWKKFDVFVQAYVDVTSSTLGWLSSSQLLMFVLVGCTFLHVECRRRGITRLVALAYIVVGFLGAISLAFPLLFAHLSALRSYDIGAVKVNSIVMFCNVAALISIVLLPITFESHRASVYRTALLVVHFLLAVPAIFGRPAAAKEHKTYHRSKLAMFYGFLAGAALLMHVNNLSKAVFELLAAGKTNPIDIVETIIVTPFRGNYCQFSISFDVVFTSVATCLYMMGSRPVRGTILALLTPFLGIPTTFATFLAAEELCGITAEETFPGAAHKLATVSPKAPPATKATKKPVKAAGKK